LASVLADRIAAGDNTAIAAMLSAPAEADLMARAGQVLGRLDCWDVPAAQADTRSVRAAESGNGRAARSQTLAVSAAAFVALCVAIGLAAIGYRQFVRRQEKRAHQAVRHVVRCTVPGRYFAEKTLVTVPVTILDISCRGCKCQQPPTHQSQKDERLDIQVGSAWQGAVVRWCNQHVAGLQFEHPLSDAQLAEIITPASQHGGRGGSTAQKETAPAMGAVSKAR
jgi:hypothetical protein